MAIKQRTSRKKTSKKVDLEFMDFRADPQPILSSDGNRKTPKELETYVKDIADTVRMGLDQSIAILTPWFFKNMPQIYYQTTPRVEKVRHLSAIISGHIFETKQTVELWNGDRTEVTFIGPGNDKDILISMVKKLEPLNVKVGSLYFSHDKLLFLSTFFVNGHKRADHDNEHISSKIEEAHKALLENYPDKKIAVDNFINNLDHDFVMYGSARRIEHTFSMVSHMLNKEGVHTTFEPYRDLPSARLTVGLKEVRASEVTENILHLIYRYGYDVIRSYIVQFEEGYDEPITVLNFIISEADGDTLDLSSVATSKLAKALRTLGWVDTDDYSQFTQEPYNFSVNAANFLRSAASWVHILLSKENPYYFSEYKIMTTFFLHHELCGQMVELFRLKFNPLETAEQRQKQLSKMHSATKERIDELLDPVERQIFKESLNFIDHILVTNYHFRTKTGLAFRLDPKVLDPKHYPNTPFGVFFITGRDYRMFHVRWKDIARGGLRIVMPRNESEYTYALAGLFDEVYGLSYAQQLKNKDIPEGGSKGVMVIRPNGNCSRAAKGAVNAFLDLLVGEEETIDDRVAKLVNYYDKEELVYLGPDENVSNDLIEWFTTQSRRRGFRFPAAFMSSKPSGGINHKEFGVTSEGLNVFVDHTLRFLGIDPKNESFTVKMTGGPDGDVAGNELKFLYREYGDNARIIAIADGYGAAYDPNGLDWKELLQLVKNDLPINHFNPKNLSKDSPAFVITANTSDNIRRRNELHFEIRADIFIPAGGRPYTVNSQNCDKFLDSKGTPTCRAIVEGANIFFSKDARSRIQENGIIMVKDSTANKTGVICSSYEIIASMLLSEDEFLKIKKRYVDEVIDILRKRADDEGHLLFRQYKQSGEKKNLVEISQDISKEINIIIDALLEDFTVNRQEILADSHYQSLVFKHCPSVLIENYKSRILKQLPEAYLISLLAAGMASSVVYNEGLGWLNSIEDRNIVRAVTTYIRNLEGADRLIDSIESSNLKEKSELKAILEKSGARVMTILALERE